MTSLRHVLGGRHFRSTLSSEHVLNMAPRKSARTTCVNWREDSSPQSYKLTLEVTLVAKYYFVGKRARTGETNHEPANLTATPDSAGMKGRGKRAIPKKTHRSTASSGTISKCQNLVTRPGIEPGGKQGRTLRHKYRTRSAALLLPCRYKNMQHGYPWHWPFYAPPTLHPLPGENTGLQMRVHPVYKNSQGLCIEPCHRHSASKMMSYRFKGQWVLAARREHFMPLHSLALREDDVLDARSNFVLIASRTQNRWEPQVVMAMRTKLAKHVACNDQGISALDNACKQHDIAFSQTNYLKQQRIADTLTADKAASIRKNASTSTGEKLRAWVVDKVMRAKVLAGCCRLKCLRSPPHQGQSFPPTKRRRGDIDSHSSEETNLIRETLCTVESQKPHPAPCFQSCSRLLKVTAVRYSEISVLETKMRPGSQDNHSNNGRQIVDLEVLTRLALKIIQADEILRLTVMKMEFMSSSTTIHVDAYDDEEAGDVCAEKEKGDENDDEDSVGFFAPTFLGKPHLESALTNEPLGPHLREIATEPLRALLEGIIATEPLRPQLIGALGH
ncbi:hypothetical protein PR048_030441 [Dryococelus australis]|uniref:Uncharacterized protein n=1 Tax=Dryococelus australis TaxID=614101 RepID=A0ABQ9G904_9NEOP|nr:hypothetical protein PR048_030441 [Dryococelus australis]